jgi:hypothetical protein
MTSDQRASALDGLAAWSLATVGLLAVYPDRAIHILVGFGVGLFSVIWSVFWALCLVVRPGGIS